MMRRLATTPVLRWAVLQSLVLSTACSPSVGGGDGGTGSSPSNTGGTDIGSGGGTATGGAVIGSGGATPGSGGATPGTGGAGTGGVVTPPKVTESGVILDGQPMYHEVVRLTHTQWEKSVQTVFGLNDETGLIDTLYPDPPNGNFSNNELSLYVSDELWQDYQRVAEDLADRLSSDSGVMAALGGLADSGAFIAKVGHRAFRRQLSAEEASAYQTLWAEGATYYASGDDAVDGARVFLEAVLQSPHFLYRNEIAAPGTRLSGTALATKLSLLLRDTIPEEALLARAEEGEFDTDAGLQSLAEEMLQDGAASEALQKFHTELYGMDRYANIHKSETAFPTYSEDMNQTFLDADLMYFDKIFTSDGGLRDILTSDTAFVTSDTAQFYDIDPPGGQGLQEVTLDGSRPGFLTRTGFLAYNATLSQPDPIHRGVNINNRILCADLAPPQGVIPPLPEPKEGQTNRERVTEHTGQGSCAGCHLGIINPLGFAFEHFDALGMYRDTDNGKPVDSADTYTFTDGPRSFEGADDLIDLLAAHPQSHGCYSANLAEFALARDVAGSDKDLVDAMAKSSLESDVSIRELVKGIIVSPLFTTAQGAGK